MLIGKDKKHAELMFKDIEELSLFSLKLNNFLSTEIPLAIFYNLFLICDLTSKMSKENLKALFSYKIFVETGNCRNYVIIYGFVIFSI